MGSMETKVIMNVKTFKDSFSLFRECVVECKNPWETSKNGMPLGMAILFSHDTQWVPSRHLPSIMGEKMKNYIQGQPLHLLKPSAMGFIGIKLVLGFTMRSIMIGPGEA
jgi:hypothetical protein